MLRLIELFAGIGAQAKALENLGIEFEHYRAVEFDKYAITSYNAIYGTNFETSDITAITAEDLGITDTDVYTYLLTYLLFPLSGFVCCREKAGYGKRKRYKEWTVVGGGKVAFRM